MDNEESEISPEEAATGSVEAVAEETEKESDEPGYRHARNGNVARLPKKVRDRLNWLILDGNTYKQVIAKLGEDGKGLKEEYIRTWKRGGYKDWLVELERKEALHSIHEKAVDLLEQKSGATIQDAGRTIAAAQLYEFLTSFDHSTFADALAKKPELYLRIISTLARLSEGEASCSHLRALESVMRAKLEPPEARADKKLVSAETLMEIARQAKLL